MRGKRRTISEYLCLYWLKKLNAFGNGGTEVGLVFGVFGRHESSLSVVELVVQKAEERWREEVIGVWNCFRAAVKGNEKLRLPDFPTQHMQLCLRRLWYFCIHHLQFKPNQNFGRQCPSNWRAGKRLQKPRSLMTSFLFFTIASLEIYLCEYWCYISLWDGKSLISDQLFILLFCLKDEFRLKVFF